MWKIKNEFENKIPCFESLIKLYLELYFGLFQTLTFNYSSILKIYTTKFETRKNG